LPYEYDSINEFVDERAITKKDGKWGVINLEGKTVIPFEYDSIEEFNDGKARAKKNGKYGFLSQDGIKLFDDVKRELATNIFIGQKFGKYGLEDKNGKELLPFKYDFIAPYTDGKAICYLNGVFKIENNQAFKPHLYTTIVEGISSFGVFLKIPYLSERNIIFNKVIDVKGLLHISEINRANKKIAEFVKGNKIDLYIQFAYEKKQHISFSFNPPVKKVNENKEI